MRIIRYVILVLLLWGASSFALVTFGDSAGSNVSYMTYLLLLGYYFLGPKRKLLLPLIILGLTYFIISAWIYLDNYKFFSNELIKYFIIVVCGAEIARDTNHKELTYFLGFGAISILVHAIVFSGGYGRYSGFYLNPNGAAFVALIGYCLSFQIKNINFKYILLFLFTFAGILTFSRFFFLMWFLTTIISIAGDKKNINVLGIGISAMILLVSVAAILQVNSTRFAFIEGLLTNNVKTQILTKDSRLDNWASYYEDILNNPFFGNGYKSFSGGENNKQGVHNTYLMALGESGIISFVLLISIYVFLVKKTLERFKDYMYKFLLALTLSAILLTMHNYFNNELILFVTIWLYVKLDESNNSKNEINTQQV